MILIWKKPHFGLHGLHTKNHCFKSYSNIGSTYRIYLFTGKHENTTDHWQSLITGRDISAIPDTLSDHLYNPLVYLETRVKKYFLNDLFIRAADVDPLEFNRI